MKTKIVIALLILAAAGGGVYWWSQSRSTPETAAPATEYVEVTRGTLVVSVSATGTVQPEYVVEIKSKASGTVDNVLVEVGSRVEKGDLLIEIDPVIENRKVAAAEADLRMAEAQKGNLSSKLQFARAQRTRDEALLAKGLVSREAVDTLRGQVASLTGELQVSDAQILKARAALEEAKDRLTETKIYAPSAGTILDRIVNPGQVITAGTATGGETLLTLADLSRLYVLVQVDEADVAKVLAGQTARITADALPGKHFLGKVLRVAPQGKVESNVTVFDVTVEITGEGRELLRPMLSANVEIEIGEAKDVVLIHRRALRQQGGKTEGGVVGQGAVPGEGGLADDRQVEIRAGLAEGARIELPTARRGGTARPGASGQQKPGAVPGLNLGGAGRSRLR